MESSNLQMLLDAAAWLNDTRAPNDIDCTGTTQSVDASISRLEDSHSVGRTKTGSILDAKMNHLKRSGERTKTTSAGRRLSFLSASRQSLPDDPGCRLQEQTHTTLTAEHPSLQTFSSSSESSILCPDESMVAECTGSTLSAIESIIKFEQLRTVDRAKTEVSAGPTLNVDINRLKRLGYPSVERTASVGRRLSFLSASKRSLPVDPGCSLQEQTHTTLTAEHPSLQTFSSSSESSIIFPDESMAECTGTTVSAVESISTHQHNKPVAWSKADPPNPDNKKSSHDPSVDRTLISNRSCCVDTGLLEQIPALTAEHAAVQISSSKSDKNELVVRSKSSINDSMPCYLDSSGLALDHRFPRTSGYPPHSSEKRNDTPVKNSSHMDMTNGNSNTSLPCRTNYSGGNLLFTRKPGEVSFFKKNARSKKSSENGSSSKTIARLSKSLPITRPANYSGGNLLFKIPHRSLGLNKRTDMTLAVIATGDTCNSNVGEKPQSSFCNTPDVQNESASLSTQHLNDLSFENVFSSTPKRKKVHENISLSGTEFQNAESDVERSKDNIKQSNPSDQPRIIELPCADDKVFDSDEDEGDNDEDVNDDEILIGDANALTDFTINEYFEKYKNQTIISDDEMDYEENKENEAFGHLGFEELEKDDIRTKKKKTPLWRINKAARERGMEYTKPDGTVVPARRLQDPCRCNYLKCHEKYDHTIREHILRNLLQLTSSGQNQFISNHMSICVTARPTVLNSRRAYTRKYYLPATNGRVRVCKEMFLATLNITDKKTRSLAAKIIKNDGICYDDQRKHNGGQNRIPEENVKFMEDHIRSFPAYSSHYSREKSSKLYLSSDLSIAKMFRLYKQKCIEDERDSVEYNSYRLCFRTFKLAFRRPSKDICNECEKFSAQLKSESNAQDKSKIQNLRDQHQAKAKRVYDEKRSDVQAAKTSDCVKTVSFDLQKCLATPHLQCGAAYYCRQLYTYNFTFFSTDGKVNVADCYLWDETKAKRGAQEIGSCILQELGRIGPKTKLINFYSDRCSGQNLNFVVCMTFLKFIEEAHKLGRQITIRHKLMVSGHSHMEVDSVHASIEKAKNRTTSNIHIPSDWEILIGSIQRKVPFRVHSMEQKDFVALKDLGNYFKRPSVNTTGEKIKFREISFFEYRSDDPKTVHYKYDIADADYLSFYVETKGEKPELKPISMEPLPLAPEKLRDLQKLIVFVTNKQYYETFLKSLVPKKRGRRSQKGIEDDFEGDLDSETDEQ